MTSDSSSIVSKVWNNPPSHSGLRRACAHVLKNAGGGYGNYVEQIIAVAEAGTTVIAYLEAKLNRQMGRASLLRQQILASTFSVKGAFV